METVEDCIYESSQALYMVNTLVSNNTAGVQMEIMEEEVEFMLIMVLKLDILILLIAL